MPGGWGGGWLGGWTGGCSIRPLVAGDIRSCSDMFDREEVIDPALLSSTSPSSDSIDMPRRVAVAVDESMDIRSGRPETEPEAVELRGSRLRPTDDSLRNCSRKDIWLLGRSPITEILGDLLLRLFWLT